MFTKINGEAVHVAVDNAVHVSDIRWRAAQAVNEPQQMVQLIDADGSLLFDEQRVEELNPLKVITICVLTDPAETEIAQKCGVDIFAELCERRCLSLRYQGVRALPYRLAQLRNLLEIRLAVLDSDCVLRFVHPLKLCLDFPRDLLHPEVVFAV